MVHERMRPGLTADKPVCLCAERPEVLAKGLEHPWALGFIGGSMLMMERPGSMCIVLRGDKVVHEEKLLQGLKRRIRDVREGPDGLLYVLTDEDDGRLIRLLPAPR